MKANKAQPVTHRSKRDKKAGKDIAGEPEMKELKRMIRTSFRRRIRSEDKYYSSLIIWEGFDRKEVIKSYHANL